MINGRQQHNQEEEALADSIIGTTQRLPSRLILRRRRNRTVTGRISENIIIFSDRSDISSNNKPHLVSMKESIFVEKKRFSYRIFGKRIYFFPQ